MIIFIDGVNGIGKSTIAQELYNRIEKGASLFEPDEIFQNMISGNICIAFSGFRPQNNRVFLKKLYYEIITAAQRNKYVIIPMTLGEKECEEEVLNLIDNNEYSIMHIILYANEETVKKRILDDKKLRDTRESLNNFEMHNSFLQKNYKDAIWINTVNVNEKVYHSLAN